MATQPKEVVTSKNYETHLIEILGYSIEAFGHIQARNYFNKISQSVEKLDRYYLVHSECRHIRTKSQMYRNIILDAHLIIYRVAKERVEVLDIVHSSSSVSKIRSTRSIQL